MDAPRRPPLPQRPLRVLQIGEGNFLRCFVGWMIETANNAAVMDSAIAVVQPLPEGSIETLRRQDGLYTVILKGLRDGALQTEITLITAVQAAIDPYTQWQEFLELSRVPTIRWVVSNTTEAGIVYQQCTMTPHSCPQSFPAKLTMLLYERFTHFGGAAEAGLHILPCELNASNGSTLRRIVLRHAEDWQLSAAFRTWLAESNHFFNTLVDRVVPGYPRDEAQSLEQELGYRDRLMVVGESFHSWIIEDPHNLTLDLCLEKAGLALTRVADLGPYRERKVRILNGAHTGTVPAALLAGLATVQQMAEHEVFGALMRRMLMDEIIPQLRLDQDESRRYAEDVLTRFANPAIRHYLTDIALNSVAKFAVRVAPSITAYRQAHAALPPILSFSLAALISLYRACDTSQAAGQPIRDDERVIETCAAAWSDFSRHGDYVALSRRLVPPAFADREPPAGLVEHVAGLLAQIERDGTVSVARSLLAG